MTFSIRFTRQAEDDLVRLYEFVLDRDAGNLALAERALQAIRHGFSVLEVLPFSFRKADAINPFIRELVIPFGSSGYVALFEIDDPQTVTVLAIRHQREDDYH